MEPPAPVTRIRLPQRKRLILSGSSRTSCLPTRSSSLTSRMVFAEMRPSISSPILGMVRYRLPVRSQSSTIRLITSPRAEGMAMRISSNWIGSSPMSSMAPRTGMPWIAWPCLRGLSSRNPTGRYLTRGLSRISRSIFSAASPCAHDEQPRPLFTVRVEKGEKGGVEEARRDGPLDVDPDQQPDPADEHQGDQGIQDEDASRKPLEATDENQDERNGPCAITAALMMLMRSAMLV